MTKTRPTQTPGDKIKKAIACLSELLETNPQKSRDTLLREVELRYDLSPAECDFLHKHFS
jgi:hypothetical protein